ncbi:four helix bundle protein [uncultured Dokdonia sp.]|uniref:four helix bundle protein n=1 Tax=uncultured Dokdonia sp. TaxID=575653 RepID=UPI00262ECE93|nr:four helix bundle protein [uncultured Dokdonia sp.]
MEKPKFKFEDLKVNQKALDFVDYTYVITKKFPKEEVYGLSSQYKRASISVPLNIAEGAGDTDAQFNRYLQMAWDSAKECVVCSSIARRQDFITLEEDDEARIKLTEIAKMTTSLKKYLRKDN